jgi:hypothetical protein
VGASGPGCVVVSGAVGGSKLQCGQNHALEARPEAVNSGEAGRAVQAGPPEGVGPVDIVPRVGMIGGRRGSGRGGVPISRGGTPVSSEVAGNTRVRAHRDQEEGGRAGRASSDGVTVGQQEVAVLMLRQPRPRVVGDVVGLARRRKSFSNSICGKGLEEDKEGWTLLERWIGKAMQVGRACRASDRAYPSTGARRRHELGTQLACLAGLEEGHWVGGRGRGLRA